jgi:predicted ATPase with chaperone activity
MQTLNQLGPAVQSGRVIYLYGPTGTGKSIIAETLTRLFDNRGIWLPYAVEVDGQIITVYDPVQHQRLAQPLAPDHDGRWVLCHRPHVIIGGELTIEMLDPQFNPSINYYAGPAQMKANNGLLIVDDFGRQRISHEQLLNRWVVPLDRRIDFLTLAGGKKIEIPFDLLLVFASNMEPNDSLADKAFLRRVQTKIKLDFATHDQFREIFRRVCLQFNLIYDVAVVDELIRMIRVDYKESLRPCYPRDIVQQILWDARYWQKEPHFDLESVTRACHNYFIAP